MISLKIATDLGLYKTEVEEISVKSAEKIYEEDEPEMAIFS